MTLSIRLTNENDLAAVSHVLAASYSTLLAPDYPTEILATIVPLISRAKPDLVASGTYFAVEDDGVIIAVGGWTRLQPGTNLVIEGLGHIRHVATDPNHLRKGAAALIMHNCLADAKRSGMTHMECLSTRTAVPFYKTCGFVAVAERELLVAGLMFPSVEMRLNF